MLNASYYPEQARAYLWCKVKFLFGKRPEKISEPNVISGTPAFVSKHNEKLGVLLHQVKKNSVKMAGVIPSFLGPYFSSKSPIKLASVKGVEVPPSGIGKLPIRCSRSSERSLSQ